MKSKSDLFHLIKAMSKSEKRYFTLDAQKSGRKDARYLELFQVINDLETYDEGVLKARFPKSLPTDKAYLYDAILRSMRDYRSANSYAARIKEMIMDAKYLYERGLYEQSEERIVGAKELAEEMGDQLSIIELNKEYRRLINFTKRKGYEQKLNQLINDKEKNLSNLREEIYYLDLLDKLVIEIRKNPQRLELSEQEKLKSEFKELFDENTQEPNSIQGKLRYYQCMGLIYQLLNNSEDTYSYFSKIVDCWDSNLKYKQEEFFRYILDVSNLLHATFSDASKADNLPNLLTKLEEERPMHFHEQKALFQRITSYRLVYAINTGEFQVVRLIVQRIDKGLKKYNLSYSSEIVILFNVAFLLFLSEEYSLCQEWSDKVARNRRLDIRQDIQNMSKILYLLATFELKRFEETEACIRNTIRYFQKLGYQKSNFNIVLLNYIKKMHSGTSSQYKQAQKQLKEYLLSMQNAIEKAPLGIDELLLYWLESKFSNRSISEIIKVGLFKKAV